MKGLQDMRRFIALVMLWGAFALPVGDVRAEVSRESSQNLQGEIGADALFSALRFDEVLEIMVREAIIAGLEMGGEGAVLSKAELQGHLEAIYQLAPLRLRFETALKASLAQRPDVLRAAIEFYARPEGKRLVAAEIAAREVLISTEATEAAEVAAERLGEKRDPRFRLLQNLMEAGDLLEGNVAANLNGARAFNEGFNLALPIHQRRKEVDILDEISAGEAEARHNAQIWLMGYLYQSYKDLPDEQLIALEQFYNSQEGRALIQAIMVAFDAAFDPVLREQGALMARMMLSELI